MDLYHRPANLFAARFLGTPGMNLFETRLTDLTDQGAAFDPHDQRCQAAVSSAGLAVGDVITVGIRPEHVWVGLDGGGAVEAGAARTAPANRVPASVTHIEAPGEHSILFTSVLGGEGAALLAKTTDESVRVGDNLTLQLPASAMHVFGVDGNAQVR